MKDKEEKKKWSKRAAERGRKLEAENGKGKRKPRSIERNTSRRNPVKLMEILF